MSHVYIYVCACIYIYNVYSCLLVNMQTCLCECLWRPKEGTRSSETGGMGGCELPDVCGGNGTLVLCKRTVS